MGESFGRYHLGVDEELLDVVTSANIACGFHAGDAATMRRTVDWCIQHDVGIGAHPGLPDLVGFGRRNMAVSAAEVYEMVVYQIGALQAFVTAAGGRMQHVKPHGALYNMAAEDEPLAAAIVQAVQDVDKSLLLFGLAGSAVLRLGKQAGLQVVSEVFADRSYQDDGTLTPRQQTGALLSTSADVVRQALRMVQEGKVCSMQGRDVSIQAETICVHGDGATALALVQSIRVALEDAGICVGRISTF